MSDTSSELHPDNERLSADSYSTSRNDATEKDKKNRHNSKRSSSQSKSDGISYSSQNDDRSEHFERLFKESQQNVSNRDVLIGMLQKQLKKIEDLYKKTLDQQQEIRAKYSNVVLELSHLQTICNKLKEENSTLSLENEKNADHYRREREALQIEVDKWKKEYDQLITSIENMEKNTCTMKHILSDDDKSKHEGVLNSNNMDQLIAQYTQIQEALALQNEKLDQFLERFQVIGDGGCTIIKSLEGIKCVNKELSKSLSSILSKEKPIETKKETKNETKKETKNETKEEIKKETKNENGYQRDSDSDVVFVACCTSPRNEDPPSPSSAQEKRSVRITEDDSELNHEGSCDRSLSMDEEPPSSSESIQENCCKDKLPQAEIEEPPPPPIDDFTQTESIHENSSKEELPLSEIEEEEPPPTVDGSCQTEPEVSNEVEKDCCATAKGESKITITTKDQHVDTASLNYEEFDKVSMKDQLTQTDHARDEEIKPDHQNRHIWVLPQTKDASTDTDVEPHPVVKSPPPTKRESKESNTGTCCGGEEPPKQVVVETPPPPKKKPKKDPKVHEENEPPQQTGGIPPATKNQSTETDFEPCCGDIEPPQQSVYFRPPAAEKFTQTEEEITQKEVPKDVPKEVPKEVHDLDCCGKKKNIVNHQDKDTQTSHFKVADCCTEAPRPIPDDSSNTTTVTCCKKKRKSGDQKPKKGLDDSASFQVKVYKEKGVGCCEEDTPLSEVIIKPIVNYQVSALIKPETDEKATLTDFEIFENNEDLAVENQELRELLEAKELEIKKLKHGHKVTHCVDGDSAGKYQEVLREKEGLQDENKALKADIENLENEVGKLQEELENAKEELHASKTGKLDNIIETGSLLHEYETSLEETNQRYAAALGELESLKEENKTLTEKLDLLNESIKQHKEQTHLCKLQFEQMNDQIGELEHTVQEMEDVKDNDSQKIDDSDLVQLQAEYNILKEDYDKLLEDNKEIGLLKKKNSNLVHELDERDLVINDLRSHIVDLENELDKVRDEMLQNSEKASKEMDSLMSECTELEKKLETTKELLEKEGELIDQEVNTSLSKCCDMAEVNEGLHSELKEKNDELLRLTEELQELNNTFDAKVQHLKNRNDYLQSALEHEQEEHQRDINAYEEKIAELKEGQSSTDNSEATNQGSSDDTEDTNPNSELSAQLEQSLQKNRILQEDLKTYKEQLAALKDSGKECGTVKAENMKLKSKISLLEKQMTDMNSVDGNLKKIRQERDEMNVKMQYLEKQLATARCKTCEKPRRSLTPIREESVVSRNSIAAKLSKNPSCFCDDKKYKISTNVTVLYDNKKFSKGSNTDSISTMSSDSTPPSDKLAKLQMRLASINRMENQVEQMISSIRRQNQRMTECNTSRLRTEKDIDIRLNNLKQKREHLMNSLNSFRMELHGAEKKTDAEKKANVKPCNSCRPKQ